MTLAHSAKPALIPSQDYLKECFEYDESTGFLEWKMRPLFHFKNTHGMNTFNSKYAGAKAGHVMPKGYLSVHVKGRHYLVHRVIWKLVTGRDPDAHIDHKDLDTSNNRWDNLREATHQQNAFNSAPNRRNRTGIKGVSWDRSRNKFYASIKIGGKTVSLGRFPSKEQAHIAYCKAAARAHGEFANTGKGVSK